MKTTLELGKWNAICDVCGCKFKSSDLMQRWDGLMVCSKDFEARHPQDFLRVRTDTPAIPWSRPVGEDTYLPICYLWDQSCYVGIAEVGCSKVGFQPLPPSQLLTLKNGT